MANRSIRKYSRLFDLDLGIIFSSHCHIICSYNARVRSVLFATHSTRLLVLPPFARDGLTPRRLLNRFHKFPRLFKLRHMACALNRNQLRVAEPLANHRGLLHRNERVPGTPNHC